MSTCVVRIWIRKTNHTFMQSWLIEMSFPWLLLSIVESFFLRKKDPLLWMLVSLVWSEEAGGRFMTWFIGSTNDPFITTTPGPSFYTTPSYTTTPSMFLYLTHMLKKHSRDICFGKFHKNCTFFPVETYFWLKLVTINRDVFLVLGTPIFIFCDRKQFKS